MALLTAHQCSVLLIDMQEKLLPAIADHEALLERVQRFIEGANMLGTRNGYRALA